MGSSHLGSLKELKITSKPSDRGGRKLLFFFFSFSQCPLEINLLQGGVRGSLGAGSVAWGMLSSACSSSLHLLPRAGLWMSACSSRAPCMLHQGHVAAAGTPATSARGFRAARERGQLQHGPSGGGSFPKKLSEEKQNHARCTSRSE